MIFFLIRGFCVLCEFDEKTANIQAHLVKSMIWVLIQKYGSIRYRNQNITWMSVLYHSAGFKS